ncbi:MAG: hypothetical protein K2L71_06505, partial [Muribaculaceae bacterium]|nr:hypothetical protein [Muribaculaceae bacterium]
MFLRDNLAPGPSLGVKIRRSRRVDKSAAGKTDGYIADSDIGLLQAQVMASASASRKIGLDIGRISA